MIHDRPDFQWSGAVWIDWTVPIGFPTMRDQPQRTPVRPIRLAIGREHISFASWAIHQKPIIADRLNTGRVMMGFW